VFTVERRARKGFGEGRRGRSTNRYRLNESLLRASQEQQIPDISHDSSHDSGSTSLDVQSEAPSREQVEAHYVRSDATDEEQGAPEAPCEELTTTNQDGEGAKRPAPSPCHEPSTPSRNTTTIDWGPPSRVPVERHRPTHDPTLAALNARLAYT
jgi:hypothetical protein